MNIEKRVQAIQDAKRMTVGEVLAHLKISPPMWSMIRARERDPTGKVGRSPSIKTIRRIEQAEREEGIGVTNVIRETPGAWGYSQEEMRRDLVDLKSDAAKIMKRADEMLKRIGRNK